MQQFYDLQRQIRQADEHAAQVAILGLDEDLPVMPRQRMTLRAAANLRRSRVAALALLEQRFSR